MEESLKANIKMVRQMATERLPILMEESLKAHTKMASGMATGKETSPDGRVFEGAYKDDKANGPEK